VRATASAARQSILCRVPRVSVGELGARLLALDIDLAGAFNQSIRRSRNGQRIARQAAGGLASAEVAIMLILAARGDVRTALRMVSAVATVYGASELIGLAWRRERPFVHLDRVEELLAHAPHRSFPSRHVASGLAMATIARPRHPKTGQIMAGLAWLLGLSRVAAGLHYPSDVLAGAVLGLSVGYAWRMKRRYARHT